MMSEERRTAIGSGAGIWIFASGSVMLMGWAVAGTQTFIAATTYTWVTAYAMGYLKLFFLGTLGELIKLRLATGSWRLDKLLQRALVWGLFGMWFTAAFPAFAGATEVLIQKGLWFDGFKPLSMSLAINIFGGFALFMMVVHEYFNYLIKNNWTNWSLVSFSRDINREFVFAFLPKTLIFWVIAHTFTFMMPPEWRVLMAAVLAIVLGFFLSVGRKKG
jgi:hypothetical protein